MPYDERVYGVAPTEQEIHNGDVFLTMVGVMKLCHIRSETSLRANAALMALRCELSPRKFVWPRDEVIAYVLMQQRGTRRDPKRRSHSIAVAAKAEGVKRRRIAGERSDSALQRVMAEKMDAYRAGLAT